MRSRGQLLFAVGLGLLAFLAVARPAAAQTTGSAGTLGTTTTSALADGDIFIGVQATEGANLSDFDLARFFNVAHCNCNTPIFLYFTLTQTGFAKRGVTPQGTVSFWVGSQCNDPLLQRTNCQFLKSDQIATFMQAGRDTIQTDARVISTNSTIATTSLDGGVIQNGVTPNTNCTSPTNGFNQTVWAIFDYGADGTIDYSATRAVFVDLTPPPTPTNIAVSPADEALNISWTLIDYSTNMDLQGYQVFCQRAGGYQVFPNNTFSSAVVTCATTANTGVDGGVDPNGVMGLDSLFACSPLLNRTVDSFRVKVLQNNIYYGATVVAIDNSGNAISPVLAGQNFTQPQKTNTFWDVYRDGNITNGSGGTMGTATPGAASGGYCSVAAGRDWAAGLGTGAGVLGIALAFARARRRRS